MPPSPSTGSSRPIVAISGITGLIGSALSARLSATGHDVRRIPRHGADAALLEGVDAVVHLAGEPVAHRWTAERKHAIRESRVDGTTRLARTIAALRVKPRVVLSGSAVGYYGDRGAEVLHESSAPGTDFLARVAVEWEAAAEAMTKTGTRVVILRTGIVLSPRGGALEKLLVPFRLGVGGPLGNGKQWTSWITLHDHVRAMEHALSTDGLHGPVNLAAPNPVTNGELATTLGHVLGRPALVPVPAFALELLYGEMARATLLAGQRAMPDALLASGFHFDHPTLEQGLRVELDMPA